MTQLSDTDEKIEKIQIALIRKLSTTERVSRLRSLSRTVINLSRTAIRRANPELSERELNFIFIMYHYGNKIAEKYKSYMDRTL
jgi:hypothetical protein